MRAHMRGFVVHHVCARERRTKSCQCWGRTNPVQAVTQQPVHWPSYLIRAAPSLRGTGSMQSVAKPSRKVSLLIMQHATHAGQPPPKPVGPAAAARADAAAEESGLHISRKASQTAPAPATVPPKQQEQGASCWGMGQDIICISLFGGGVLTPGWICCACTLTLLAKCNMSGLSVRRSQWQLMGGLGSVLL